MKLPKLDYILKRNLLHMLILNAILHYTALDTQNKTCTYIFTVLYDTGHFL